MVMQDIKEDPETRIKKWLGQLQTFRNPITIVGTTIPEESDLDAQIREAAYYLSLKNPTYEDLCWSLAEKVQKEKNPSPTIDDIRKTAEEISNSSKTYDELCWLNAELEISTKK
ncbi:MAG: hypothetical protein ACFE9I_09260 [Candidatus Hermodarchaeota archaeon]